MCSLFQAVDTNRLGLTSTIDIYCASRSLYGLARDRQAPKIFAKTLANGNPTYAVALASVFIALGYMNASSSTSTVFQNLVNLFTILAVLNWMAVLVSHISFRRAVKAQGVSLGEMPYVAFGQPWGSYYALFISFLIIVFNGKWLSLVNMNPKMAIVTVILLTLRLMSCNRLRCLYPAFSGGPVRFEVHRNCSLRH